MQESVSRKCWKIWQNCGKKAIGRNDTCLQMRVLWVLLRQFIYSSRCKMLFDNWYLENAPRRKQLIVCMFVGFKINKTLSYVYT